ncbi:MAG: hypothetical protein J6U93_07590 [Alistipes sp.]|nr:hypothetical protein [Alistipes sp.]
MPQDIEDTLRKRLANELNAMVSDLYEIGLSAVNAIRQNHAYKDQTGNLTSSVGCAVVVEGEIMQISDFESIKPTGAQGSQDGKAYIQSLASQFPTGITLIVVAGMNYAAYVERRGIGGMTGGELFAKQAVEDLLLELQGK